MVPRELAPQLAMFEPNNPAYAGAISRWTRGQAGAAEGLRRRSFRPPPIMSCPSSRTSRGGDLDGLHLDYIRYPKETFDYSRHAIAQFRTHVAPTLSDAHVVRLTSVPRWICLRGRTHSRMNGASSEWRGCQRSSCASGPPSNGNARRSSCRPLWRPTLRRRRRSGFKTGAPGLTAGCSMLSARWRTRRTRRCLLRRYRPFRPQPERAPSGRASAHTDSRRRRRSSTSLPRGARGRRRHRALFADSVIVLRRRPTTSRRWPRRVRPVVCCWRRHPLID